MMYIDLICIYIYIVTIYIYILVRTQPSNMQADLLGRPTLQDVASGLGAVAEGRSAYSEEAGMCLAIFSWTLFKNQQKSSLSKQGFAHLFRLVSLCTLQVSIGHVRIHTSTTKAHYDLQVYQAGFSQPALYSYPRK